MKQEFDFIGDCSPIVHDRITKTLNNLPRRNKLMMKFNFTAIATVSIAAVLMLFIATWTINPVLAQGNFRDILADFLSVNPQIEEIVEAPLPAPETSDVINEVVPQETATLVTSDDNQVEVPSVIVDGYEFRLEDQIVYDGTELILGYNVRKVDGSLMPSVEEFTKDHLAGFIRERELVVDGEVLNHGGAYSVDWDDPYVYSQVMSIDLSDVNQEITEETQFILRIGMYYYNEPPIETVEEFIDLPFCVNTEHENISTSYELEQSIYDMGDFIVEVLPVVKSATKIQIEIRGYKEDDPDFGKNNGELLFMRVEGIDNEYFADGSLGFGFADDGSTYLESVYGYLPTVQLPKQFIVYFTCGDSNTGEDVGYEPITVTFK